MQQPSHSPNPNSKDTPSLQKPCQDSSLHNIEISHFTGARKAEQRLLTLYPIFQSDAYIIKRFFELHDTYVTFFESEGIYFPQLSMHHRALLNNLRKKDIDDNALPSIIFRILKSDWKSIASPLLPLKLIDSLVHSREYELRNDKVDPAAVINILAGQRRPALRSSHFEQIDLENQKEILICLQELKNSKRVKFEITPSFPKNNVGKLLAESIDYINSHGGIDKPDAKGLERLFTFAPVDPYTVIHIANYMKEKNLDLSLNIAETDGFLCPQMQIDKCLDVMDYGEKSNHANMSSFLYTFNRNESSVNFNILSNYVGFKIYPYSEILSVRSSLQGLRRQLLGISDTPSEMVNKIRSVEKKVQICNENELDSLFIEDFGRHKASINLDR